jgi:hypothetical protein
MSNNLTYYINRIFTHLAEIKSLNEEVEDLLKENEEVKGALKGAQIEIQTLNRLLIEKQKEQFKEEN